MMLKREIICVVVLVSSLVSACTDGNCLTCLPHDQNFCITCASTHRVKDGLCVADCDPDNTGYTEFLDSNGNKRCLNTFAIACTSPCQSCIQGAPTTCLSCIAGKFLEDSSCVDTCSTGLIEEEGLCKGNRRFDEFICAPGTYNDQTGSQASTACKNCESGKFCAGFKGTSNDGNCDAGYYCTGQAQYAKNHDDIYSPAANTRGGRCTAGNSCPAGSTTQASCPAGKYCQRDGLASPSGNCQAGYYCIGGSATPVPDGSSPAIGLPCPIGHYCEEGQAAQQCPTGTYMPYTGASSLSECIPCDPGKYCGTSGASDVTNDCDAGYFCQGGASSAQPEGGICPKGYKCSAGSASPEPCPLTQYQDEEGKDTCKACTAGNYCTEIAMLPCPAGYYCLANNDKRPCPRGRFRTATGATQLNDCDTCTAGFACPSNAITTPTIQCKAGYYCTGSAITDMPTSGAQGGGLCSQGNFCPLGSTGEQACPAGKYCPSQGLAAAAGDCQAGYYCSGGSITGTPSGVGGNICSVGHFCPAGSQQEQSCPDHTYINYTGADDSGDCAPCPAGLTCSGGVITNTACPAGKYCDHSGAQIACDAGYMCPQGSRDQIPCPPGKYQSATSQNICLNCPAGKYCEDLATITPADCPDGYFCPQSTIARFDNPCPIGYRGLGTGKSTQNNGCQECDNGRYCAEPGLTGTSLPLCDSGYFCAGGVKVPRPMSASDCITASNCGLCPAGYFCSEGVASGTPCPEGTYRPYTGAKSTDDCMPVPPGKYNSGTGLITLPVTSTGTYGDCNEGYICTGGSSSATPSVSTMGYTCSAGYFCAAGATHQQMCAVGFYQDLTQQGSCKQCPLGKYCPTEGLSSPITCEAGYYCEAGSIRPKPCPRGKYLDTTGNDAQGDCLACPAGKYCQTEGMASADNDCSQGHVCVGGATTPTPEAEDYGASNLVNGLCPKGHFCQPGTSSPDHCLAGTYNPSLGLGSCVTCPPGYFCPSVQIDALTPSNECAAGYVCTAGAEVNNPTDGVKGKVCPAGFFCEQGTAKELGCVDGTYQPATQQFTCDSCPAGSLCQNSVQSDCVERKFCPLGSSYGQLCPNGRENELTPATNLSAGDQCAACPATKYCMGGLVIGFCQAGFLCTSLADSPTPNLGTGIAEPCPADNYCEIGQDIPNQCPSQKFTAGAGKMQESDCVDCANGYYCDNSGTQSCPAGSYCPNGSSTFTQCPLYTYNPLIERFHLGHCIPCPAGYFCDQLGVGDLSTVTCTPGYYCVQKATYEIPCPAGTYRSDATLGVSYASCLSCPSGYYCPLATGTPIACSDNEYCLGSSLPEPCPPGKQCTINILGATFPQQEMVMIDCPVNFYCEEGNAGPQACASDKFCPTGSAYEQICDIDVNTGMCNSCPGGQWSTGMSECSECPAGYVCSGGTNTKYPANPATQFGYKCPVGHYCPAGSASETPCPIGTYNPTVKGESVADCLQCTDATYNYETGQSSCRSCGTAAYTSDDGTSCRCYGAYRAFQKHDASCTCKTGYSFETVDGSSSSDNCEPIPLPNNCGYNHLGVCGTNCVSECNNPDATMTSEGVCACTAEPTGTACDATCQDGFLNVQVSENNEIQISSGSDVVTTPLDQIPNTMGSPSCSSPFCKLVSIVGGAITSYEPAAKFVNLFKNTFSSYTSPVRNLALLPRQLTDITLFQSPVICVAPDTTIAFDTSNNNYPVYMKDSMLNTNQFFDYSEFEILGSRLSLGSANIDTFFFTFTQQGVYMFEDSVTPASKTIISVTSAGCPEAYISELSNAALSEFNVSLQDRGVKEIFYWPIGLLVGFFATVLVAVSIVLGYLVKIDRFDVEIDRAAMLDNGKASQDLRLLAIKRKLEEMIKQVREEKNKKHSDEWQRESVGRLQNFQDELQLLIESLGLKEPEDNIIEEEGSESSRLSDIVSSMSGGGAGVEYRIEEEARSHESADSKLAQRDDEDDRVQGGEEVDLLKSKQVPEQHALFLNSDGARKTLEKRRVEFEAELRKRNLTGDEKRAQVEEFEQMMAQLQYTLEEEEEKQKAHLLHELKKRRKNVNKEQAKLGDVINREKALKERHAKEIEALGKTLRQKEKEIDKAYDEELRNLKRDEIRKKNEALKKFKADFHRKIKRVADPADVKALEAKHDSSYKEFLKAFEEEQAEQNKHLYERLAERKKKKVTQLQLTFESQMNEHAQRQDQEMLKEVLEEKIKLQAEHNLFQEDQKIGGVDLEKEKELKKQQDMERELALVELANDQIADRNLVEIEFHSKEEELEREAEEGKLELPSEIALREKKEEFKARLDASSTEKERKALLKEQDAALKEIQKQLERESKNQSQALELRKLQLKEKKEAKLIQVQRQHDRERREKELEVLEQQDAQRQAQHLKEVDAIVKKALEEGKISQQELPLTVDNFLSQFATQQLKNLLNRQYIETSRAMGDVMSANLSERMQETKALKDRFEMQFKELEKADLPAKEFAEQTKKLQQEKEQELQNIEARYKIKQMDEEGRMKADLAKKHAEQKLRLKEEQMKLKEDTMDRLIDAHAGSSPETKLFLRQLKKDLLKNAADDLREYHRKVEEERNKTMEEMKKKLFFDNEEEMEEFEVRFRQELKAEQEKVEKRLQKEKEEIIKKRKKSFDQRLKRMEGMAQSNVEVYVAEHDQNMRRLDQALEAERQKQLASIHEKLKMRRMKQKKLKHIAPSPNKPGIGDLTRDSPSASFYKSKSGLDGPGIGLKKAEIDYKVKLKEWAQRVKEEPPLFRDRSYDDVSLLNSSVDGLSHLDDSRLRGVSVYSADRNPEDELMERVMKIERMAKLLLE